VYLNFGKDMFDFTVTERDIETLSIPIFNENSLGIPEEIQITLSGDTASPIIFVRGMIAAFLYIAFTLYVILIPRRLVRVTI
jgi:hypothetical protein